jgi:hypothetical protein
MSRRIAMQMPKPSDEDKARFAELVVSQPGAETKPMFGQLGAFVNGNMFMGLFGSQIGVKLPPEELQELLAHPEAGPFGPEERPMGGYAALPPGWSTAETRPWVEKAFAYVAALPPKKK